MTFVVQMLLHTPAYVYLLLAWLVWRGMLSLGLRTVALWRLFIVPSVFAANGLLMLVWRANTGLPEVAAWLVSAVALVPIGYMTGPRILAVDPSGRSVTCAGSTIPLARNLLIFSCQYGIAVALFLHPGETRLRLEIAARAVSGISIGYFTGWVMIFLKRYRELRRQPAKSPAPIA
ncbi:MAG TPA: DUF6622 family protein [Stellaceae bacterium]|nr:DUF6622 family protein [Stellaceae bacterium]